MTQKEDYRLATIEYRLAWIERRLGAPMSVVDHLIAETDVKPFNR